MRFYPQPQEVRALRAKGYWFAEKCFGWGWTPITWQGWFSIVAVVVSIFFFTPIAESDPILFALILIAHILILFILCLYKGPLPRWRWDCTPGKK